jgi:hypothetical protein
MDLFYLLKSPKNCFKEQLSSWVLGYAQRPENPVRQSIYSVLILILLKNFMFTLKNPAYFGFSRWQTGSMSAVIHFPAGPEPFRAFFVII